MWAAGKDSFSIYREISDRKRVKVVEQEFQTREDAMKYMAIHAIEILETNTTFGEIDLPRPENTVRKGLDRRKGDAKDADFIRVFGFRGVEFGNWNNQAERQELLNDAFDGLMDLAEILNIPPAAIPVRCTSPYTTFRYDYKPSIFRQLPNFGRQHKINCWYNPSTRPP